MKLVYHQKAWPLLCFHLIFFVDIRRSMLTQQSKDLYANTWVIELTDDHPDTIKRVSADLFLHYHGPVGGMHNHHVVQHRTLETGKNTTADIHHKIITSHRNVKFAQQEKILSRKKRGGDDDPLFENQWYLKNTGENYSIQTA